MKLKAQIEAILFLTDKPIKAAAIARQVNEDVQVVRQALLELIHDYEDRDGGLEIANDDGYAIQVRDEYASIIDDFAPMDMPIALVRTLSAIALKQPVTQSEIIKIRGAGAYEHVKELMLRELIQKKEEGGRSPALSTTKKFQEYFRLSQDAKSLRQDLSKQKKDAAIAESAENAEGSNESTEADNIEFEEMPMTVNMQEEVRFIDELAGISGADRETEEEVAADAGDGAQDEEDSKDNLEKIFAESFDSSLIFRPSDKDLEISLKDSESEADT
ncbi:MAG: SMC-Scp complex subunit ScpB [Candidatus Obscuribacterales bacterium]|nr:SMC-Scp complex subunit ScpB [Candidatus Obscuribacterales bacterium]